MLALGIFISYGLKNFEIFKDEKSIDKDSTNIIKIDYDEKKDLSLVKVMLKTGRHHQIRVQFSSRNHPLVGDNRYGIDNEKEIGLFE